MGLLSDIKPDIKMMNAVKECARMDTAPGGTDTLPGDPSGYIAVATREGVLVNQHLGEAFELSIYDASQGIPKLVEKRAVPEPGGMDLRWHALAEIIRDCDLVLAGGAGESPRRVLAEHGIQVMIVNGLIQEIIHGVKNQLNINHLLKREPFKCTRAECSGSGMGCM